MSRTSYWQTGKETASNKELNEPELSSVPIQFHVYQRYGDKWSLNTYLTDLDGLWTVRSGRKWNDDRIKYDPVEFINAMCFAFKKQNV
jgi:hypothetical protein